MSDIDRIAEKYGLILDHSPRSSRPMLRAALLEYGEIVREECAQVADRSAKLSMAFGARESGRLASSIADDIRRIGEKSGD